MNFTKGSLKAFIDNDGLLKIGINHANQDRYPFTLESKWTTEQVVQAWLDDMRWQIKVVNKWLTRDVEQHHFEMLVDLMRDELMIKGARPVTLFQFVNEGQFELASEQFLRWIVDDEGKASLSRIKRAFARRAYFCGHEWRHFAKCPTHFGDIVPLNDLIIEEGYRVVTDFRKGFVLERIA